MRPSKRERARDNLASAAVLLALLLFAGLSLTYGERARLVPLIVAVTSIVLLALQLVLQNRRSARHPALEPDGEAAELLPSVRRGEELASKLTKGDTAADGGVTVIEEPKGSPLGGVLLVAAFVVLIVLLGVLPAVLLYVFAYLVVISRVRMALALVTALATEIVIYVLFVLVLKVQMYEGQLATLLG